MTRTTPATQPTGAGLGGAAGAWRNVGGVMRWQPEPPEPVQRPRRKPQGVHHLIACGACGARVDERCRSAGGFCVADHEARLVSVRCPCGERVKPKHRYCSGACREKARRATYWRREVRNPTAQRRAS